MVTKPLNIMDGMTVCDKKTEEQNLHLCLDSLFGDGYFYTEYDIGGEGHGITIKGENKEKFLDAFAAEFRKRAEGFLEPIEEEDNNE